MRTLVISDLHLGVAGARDVLRREAPLEALREAVAEVDRLVLLGDVVELRHDPVRDALAVAEPVLARLAEALPAHGSVVVVPGNHDHELLRGWLDRRDLEPQAPPPLALDELVDGIAGPEHDPLRRVTDALGAAGHAVEVRYPGVWLRDDVYATHGHYLDRLITIPTFERLASGAMARVVGPLPDDRATPEQFEAALAPLYAWMMHAVAQFHSGWTARRQTSSAALWQTLAGEGPRRWRVKAAAAALPAGIAAINRAGIGPVKADISGPELRRAALSALGEVVRRLDLQAARHVVFGHTHRAGPLDGDALHEWRAPTGATLHNPGCWVDEPTFARTGGTANPYYAGRAVRVEPEGPPQTVRLTSQLR